MKRWLAALAVLILFVGFGQVQGAILPLDGTWTVVTQVMNEGDFFTDTWTFSSASTVKFTITDVYVISDRFEVYDFGGLVATTPLVPDWDAWFSSPFDFNPSDPDTALASGYFSSATILFAPGSHSITIRDIHIPSLIPGGTKFADGTVAFKAEVVPEPATVLVWGLFGAVALAGAWWARRKRTG